MKTRWTWWVAICLIGCTSLLNLCAVPAEQGEEDNPLQHITLPEGFRIDYFAQNVTNARSMARGDNGTLFVGTRREGKVYAIVDRDNDFKADQVYTLASGLNMPNGVAFRNGSLYVAEVNRVMRFDAIESQLENPPEPVVVNDQFPSDRHHGWKYIAFGPDDKLYVPVGAPCNICEKDEEIYSSITRMDPDGSNLEVYAHGVRNSVGFTWHPTTGHLWFTDNGRDMLGDDLPADELNNAPSAGMHFGYPYCHQGDTPDPEFGAKRNCDEFTPPALKLGAHVAALGMLFYTGSQLPNDYHHRALICQHGSWNRTEPIGYRIMMADVNGNQASNYQVFAEGWLRPDGDRIGRPVDILQLPDGSLLVSDDYADAIYRISYEG